MSLSGRSRIPLTIRTNQDSSSPSSSSTYDSAKSHLTSRTVDIKTLSASPATRIPRLKPSPDLSYATRTIAPLSPIRTPESGQFSRPHGLPLNTITERKSTSTISKTLPELPAKPLPALPTETPTTERPKDSTVEMFRLASPRSSQALRVLEPADLINRIPNNVLDTTMDQKTLELCREIDSIWSCSSSTLRRTIMCPSSTT